MLVNLSQYLDNIPESNSNTDDCIIRLKTITGELTLTKILNKYSFEVFQLMYV